MSAGVQTAESNGAHYGHMSGSLRAEKPPLEDAILAWDGAVAAVLQETDRIAGGGTVDPVRLGALRAAVEEARLQCEALAVQIGRKEGPL